MYTSDIFNILGLTIIYTIFAIPVVVLILLYLKNLWKVIQTIKGNYVFTIRTIIRIFGIFFPLLGIAMGLVNGS